MHTLQAMQVLISSVFPAKALFGKSGSATSGLSIQMRSALPCARISSASSGLSILLITPTGMETALLIAAA